MLQALIAIFIFLQPSLQSLESVRNIADENERITAYIDWLAQNHIKESQLSLTVIEEALPLARKQKNIQREAHFTHFKAIINGNSGNYQEAIKLGNDALNLLDGTNSKLKTRIVSYLGTVYGDLGDFTTAAKYFQDALELGIQDNDSTAIMQGYLRLGVVYDRMELVKESREIYLKALDLAKQLNDIKNQIDLYNNLAVTHARRSEYEDALKYFLESEKLYNKDEDFNAGPMLLTNIGRIYMELGNLLQAQKYLEEAQILAEKSNVKTYILLGYNNLSDLYIAQNNLDKAELLLIKGVEIAKETRLVSELSNFYLNLAKVYKLKGQYDKALNFSEQYHVIKDSLFSIERLETIKSIEAKYELEQKNSELSLLQELNDSRTSQRNLFALLFVGIVAFLIILIIFYFRLQDSKEKLELKREQLEASNAMKNRLFNIIGHDLRNPFHGIVNGIKLIAEDDLTIDERKNLVRKLLLNIEETLKVLEDLLLWGRAESYQTKIDVLELPEVIAQTIKINNGLAQQKEIGINFETKDSFKVYADLNEVQFVFRNLIQNAIKFSHKNSQIEIWLEKGDQVITTRIEDHGIGISKDNLERIRNEMRVDSEFGTSGEKGSGLGLMICYDLIRKNHGKIEVMSEIAKGTTFIISLPRAI